MATAIFSSRIFAILLALYGLKGTPAKLLGNVKAPDEESAIKRAIEEFGITDPHGKNGY